MKKNNNFLGNVFDAISSVLNGAERALLDLISVIVPYCVPLPVAYLTYFHTVKMMAFPDWLGWTSAFTIEALGLASVSTAIRFYRNNKSHKSEKERAPFGLALGVYIFYIVVTITLNVVLEIVDGTRQGWIIFSIGLFTLLSVPSGILISIRSLYTELLEERNEKKQERQQPRALTMAYSAETTDNIFTGKRAQKTVKLCGCGCGESFAGRADKIYISNAHRMRHERAQNSAQS